MSGDQEQSKKRARDDDVEHPIEESSRRKSPRLEDREAVEKTPTESDEVNNADSAVEDKQKPEEEVKPTVELKSDAPEPSVSLANTNPETERPKDEADSKDEEEPSGESTNEKDATDKAAPDQEESELPKKPVFGSSFAFGKSFGSERKNIFDTPSSSSDVAKSVSSKPIFGSGLAFGGAFKATENIFDTKVKQGGEKNIFDSNGEEETKEEEEKEGSAGAKEQYVQLETPLEEKKIETGEENEDSVFSCRAKLYAMDLTQSDQGWKERGVGTLHLNTMKLEDGTTKNRIVMRADGVLKVILNLPLLKNFEVMSGMKSSLSSEKFVRLSALENGKPLQYALRTSSGDTSAKLFDKIKELIPTE
ncbi:ran-specific GTPase-activating protein 2 [Trichomonascus vanleenenianus]|uniref:Yrb2p n=1 Tax=Trichomonascus vanleenenianus TaxID=2268995 RepID=UPI003ECAE42A